MGSIGILGVVAAILFVLMVRGCVLELHQEDITDYCQTMDFHYGSEIVRHTVIKCESFDDNVTEEFNYAWFTNWRDEG